MYVCSVAQSCPTLCDPKDCSPPDSSVHGDSPGKNTGVGCHALLQGIFPTQGWNPGSIPGSGRFPWRRKWQLTPVFLPGESLWTEEPGGLQSLGSQRVGHDERLTISTNGGVLTALPSVYPKRVCLRLSHWFGNLKRSGALVNGPRIFQQL